MGSSPKGATMSTSAASHRSNGTNCVPPPSRSRAKEMAAIKKGKTTTSSSSRLLRGITVATVFVSLAAASLFFPSSAKDVSKTLSENTLVSSLRGFLAEKPWKVVVTRLQSSKSSSSIARPSTCDPRELSAAAAKLSPLATRLVSTPFFRHFKVALRCECPFWPDDGTCSMSDCAVCECSAEEVPEALRDGDEPRELASCPALSKSDDDDAAVDREVEPGTRARLIAAKGWRGVDNPWMAGSVEEETVEGEKKEKEEEEVDVDGEDEGDDEEDGEDEEEDGEDEEEGEDYSFIDLLKNPERYTGYSGPSARRVWDFVYSQSCFGGLRSGGGGPSSSTSNSGGGVCSAVQQTLYRVMSGVHASISAHIAADFLLEPSSTFKKDDGTEIKNEAKWGPNLALFAERLSLPDHSERIDNLRFAYAFVARALLSARPLLLAADYSAGGGGGSENGASDGKEAELVRQLLTDPALEGVCAAPFDAARHLPLPSLSSSETEGASKAKKSASNRSGEVALEKELQAAFRNVTAVMDCVGCEKCRVWGKLQLMGVATALKVLVAERKANEFAASLAATAKRRGSAAALPPPLVLERNEVVALVNLFERLSRSMNTAREMQARLDAGEIPEWPASPASDKLRGRGEAGVGGVGFGGDALAGALGVF